MFKNRSREDLPVGAWLTESDSVIGLLLSSFVINLLGLVFPIAVLQFYDRIIPNDSISTLILMIAIVICALALETTLKLLRSHVSSWAHSRFTYNISGLLFKHLIRSNIKKFEENTPGVYLDRFNSADSVKEYYCGQNLIMLVDLPFVFIYISLLLFINKYLAMVPTIIVFSMLIHSLLTAKNTQEKLSSKTRSSEVKNKFLIEVISGIHTIKSFGMEEQFLRRYERLHKKEILSNYQYIQETSESTHSGSIFSQVAIVTSVCIGGILVMKQMLTVGGLAASILLVGKIMQPIIRLISFIEKRNNLLIAKEDLAYLKNIPYEQNEELPNVENVTGEIKLANVSFKYDKEGDYILKDVNVLINPHETIAIHGGHASGKSTLMMMMAGIYKPDQGDVYIDNNNIQDFNLSSYRQNIAYMPTNGNLFNGTILENMTLFEVDKYEGIAKEIAKQIGLHEIIEKMPQAYNTHVGSGTVDLLSIGNKQQILIVRSLLNEPNVILFDEANISLDIDTDVKLRKFLLTKKEKCTIVMITHRPSLLAMADRHYKFEDKNLKEFKWEQNLV